MKQLKQVISAALATVATAVALVCPAQAAEVTTGYPYQPLDAYVLNYNGVYDGPKWQYFSPYYPAFSIDGGSSDTSSIVFSLYNTVDGSVVPVYCTDIETGLANNSYFRRVNLEDSTYAATSAGLLRAIVLNGFPNVSAQELGAAAGVANLTPGEAVAATQAAIWKAAHGERLVFTDFVCYIDTQWSSAQNAYYDLCNAEIASGYACAANKDLIASHIEAAYSYLISLEPVGAAGRIVSNSSIVATTEPVVTPNADGATCSVTASATVDLTGYSGSGLTLSAVVNGYYASVSLAGVTSTATFTLTVPNVPADQAYGELFFAIDGYQAAPRDVYLFDARGGRSSSQSLIGIDGGAAGTMLPLHAQVTAGEPRVVYFTKTTSGGAPLAGIQFDVYYIASYDEYLAGGIELTYNVPSYTADYTVTTNAAGYAEFNLTELGCVDGLYLVVERAHPSIKAPVGPFYVFLPATSEDGTTLEYTVTVKPKNDVYEGPAIEKDVVALGNEDASVSAVEPHTWIVSATIPVDIIAGEYYVVRDVLDNRLDFVGNVKVQVETADGATVALQLAPGADYTLAVTDVDSLAEGAPSDSFEVALTTLGMQRIAALGNLGEYRVRVYFDAQLNGNAAASTAIPNQATLAYANQVGMRYDAQSDKPVVHTGGLDLSKVDSQDATRVLAGAEFVVYRKATEQEVADDTVAKVQLGDMAAQMVAVRVFNNPGMDGAAVDSIVTDAAGKAYAYGLPAGEYWLLETKAPAGYQLTGEPIRFVIEPFGADAEGDAEVTGTMSGITVLEVANVSGAVLPQTGGSGTWMYTVVGLVLAGLAVVGVVLNNRK